MNRIRNRKFVSLVENLKTTNNTKKHCTDSIQLSSNYNLFVPFKKKRFRSLLNLFNQTDQINRTAKKIIVQKIDAKPIIYSEENTNFENNKTNNINIPYLNTLTKSISDIGIIYSIKKGRFLFRHIL